MTLQWQTALYAANKAKRCGANVKSRPGNLCQAPAMSNGRCRVHGGKSPGAPKGQKHGRYNTGLHTQEMIARRKYVNDLISSTKRLLAQIDC